MDPAGEIPQSSSPTGGESRPVAQELRLTERKLRIGFALALACLGLVAVVSYLSVVRLNENTAWVEHTHEVLSRLELLLAAATDCETAERGYVITGDVSYLDPCKQGARWLTTRTSKIPSSTRKTAFATSSMSARSSRRFSC